MGITERTTKKMIPNFLGALLGVIAGHLMWQAQTWWQRRRAAKRAPITATPTFSEPEDVYCPRCEHDHASRIAIGLSVEINGSDVEGGPVGWFTECMCEDGLDVMRRKVQLLAMLESTMDDFLQEYEKGHKRRPKADKAAAALIEHMVTAAKAYSHE